MIEHITQSNLIEMVRDPKEVTQSLMAWNWLIAQENITKSTVLELHSIIMENLLHQYIGVWRPYNVEVGGRGCPHWSDVLGLMERWINDMQYWETLHPKEMHIEFELIHPFVDGNGRTGRMLMWWHETKLGKEPTLITYEDRWKYYNWFDSSSKMETHYDTRKDQ